MLHMQLRGGAVALLSLAVLSGCPEDSTDPGNGPVSAPKTVVTKQERIEATDWTGVLAEDADLASIAGGMNLVAYGVLEDTDGNVVTWAEADNGEAAVRFCEGGTSCVAVKQGINADGSLSWTDAAGGSVTPKVAGKPQLLKTLQGNDLAGKTVLAVELDKADLPGVDFAQRQFHLLNTFGGALDVNLDGVSTAVTRHGGFDVVQQTSYVREGTILPLLEDLDHMDAVVWLSQGVRQEVISGSEYKTIGLTVNRAAFGEATLDFQQLKPAADANVAGGPGLLILAANNSYSDGSANQPASGSIWQTLDDGQRTLVGVQGEADVNRVLAAVEKFVDLYLTGDIGLADAIDQANTVFAGTTALLRTNQDDGLQRYLKSYDSVWAEAGYTPTSARLTTYIAATPYCDDGPQTNSFAAAWADVTFDGAYFEGSRADKVDNAYTTSTNVRGVLTRLEVGAAIFVEFWGGLDKAQFQDTYGFGEGTIVGVETLDDGNIEVTFNGDVNAAPYTDDRGQTCQWSTPKLTTTTSAPSKLVLTP